MSFRRLWGVMFSDKYLLLTNTVTTVSLLGVGDYIDYRITAVRGDDGSDSTDHKNSSDNARHILQRSMRVASSGVLLGPMNHFWYRQLDGRIAGRTATELLTKVGLDFAVSPIFAGTFISTVASLEGSSPVDALREYYHKFWSILKLDFLFWPPTQLVNFYFVPPQGRVIYVSVVTLFYNVCICHIKHKKVIE